MLVAAAVCPHPPLLVPEVTGDGFPEAAGAKELGDLRSACGDAVAGLLRLRPDVLAIVGGRPADASGRPADGSGRPAEVAAPSGQDGLLAEYALTAPGCLARFGVRSSGADPATRAALGHGADGSLRLPLSLTIGRWLADRAGQARRARGAVRLYAVPGAAPPAGCLAAGAGLAGLAPRVALLVMGDGTARRAQGVPGAADPEAERYDAEAAAAFAKADTAALAALDPGTSASLLAAGRAPWQVLAGAADGSFQAEVLYAAAPFEVGYVVATWRRAP